MKSTDPRFPDYALLQRVLCATLNRACHWDTTHWRVDEVAWDAYQRDEAADELRDEMRQIMAGGLDDCI